MTLKELFEYGSQHLKNADIDDAELDSKLLCYYVLDTDGVGYFLNSANQVDKEKAEEFKQLINRRSGGEPLQYIIGKVEFMGFEFHVAPGVLIPRPETELLVEKAVNLLEDYKVLSDGGYEENSIETSSEGGKLFHTLKILDLCCGSGVIGLSLAKLWGSKEREFKISVDLSDISFEALKIARENCNSLAPFGEQISKINFFQGSYLEAVEKMKTNKYDMILCNPPYIASEEVLKLQSEVRNYEPHLALDGGIEGLDPYKVIIPELKDFLLPDGIIMFEIGHDQKKSVENLFRNTNNFKKIETLKDLACRDRIVWAVLR